jgi:hypothetical protein
MLSEADSVAKIADRLTQNVDNKLTIYAVQHPRRATMTRTLRPKLKITQGLVALTVSLFHCR